MSGLAVLGLGFLCGAVGIKFAHLLSLIEARDSEMMDDDGDFHKITDTFEGKPIFRKTRPNEAELKIAQIIQAHPHPNVVTIYHASHKCIDMERLTTCRKDFNRQDIERAHDHFLKHDIVYLDWKSDNFGTDQHGVTKVFDFNMSGIMNDEHTGWEYPPEQGYMLERARDNGSKTPLQQDSSTFAQVFGSDFSSSSGSTSTVESKCRARSM
jgi:hypothetical protein